MPDARSRELRRNGLVKVEKCVEMDSLKSDTDMKPEKKVGMPCQGHEVKNCDKLIFSVGPVPVSRKMNKEEAEITKRFELVKCQSRESRRKKKRFI